MVLELSIFLKKQNKTPISLLELNWRRFQKQLSWIITSWTKSKPDIKANLLVFFYLFVSLHLKTKQQSALKIWQKKKKKKKNAAASKLFQTEGQIVQSNRRPFWNSSHLTPFVDLSVILFLNIGGVQPRRCRAWARLLSGLRRRQGAHDLCSGQRETEDERQVLKDGKVVPFLFDRLLLLLFSLHLTCPLWAPEARLPFPSRDAISAAQEELVLADSTLLFTCLSSDLTTLSNAASSGLT